MLTLLRALLIPPIVLCILWQPPRFLALTLAMLWIACITDILDGHIARAYNQATDFGAVSDALTDKIMMYSAMFALFGLGAYWPVVLFPMFIRDMFTDGLRSYCASKGEVVRAFAWGKVKFGLQFASLNAVILAFWLPEPWAFRSNALGNILLAAALAVALFGTIPVLHAFTRVSRTQSGRNTKENS